MLDLVQKLLEQDDSAQLTDAKGYTCLHEAARMGDLDIANLCLENNANPWARTYDNSFMACHLAARHGHAELMNMFLSKDIVDRNAVTDKHETVLDLALMYGQYNLSEVLAPPPSK